ncbi:MAG: bifunctional phosphopantothenoylcysteine decarboxylase/phosphopantothenate--cysteine ligase CoaBC, partial [Alphaproteobacteria bacterium]|nr:bifunctional phosphopantothenoylcysteine decarboxylase/phosphopantothenate--cysteine ligase CoaBC [Alphaproteobacteria bacterium]
MLENKKILLIISGGIAAYKSLELIRGLRKNKAEVNCILTENASKIVTPLVVASLSEGKVHQEMFSLVNGSRIGHVQLSRGADLIVAAPATANLIAKMALGIADNLASTTLLAANKPVMIAPAMNTQMWKHHATQKNMKTLEEQGIICTGPKKGGLACGEVGEGRMSEPQDILDEIIKHLTNTESLKGKKALVTSGATQEPIDAVRFLSNYSSGKQGHAIAKALAEKGADVTLVSGVVSLPDPAGVKTVHVKTADEMMTACNQEKSVDIAVCAAAVADWKIVNPSKSK